MAHGIDCSYVETRLRDTERRMMATLELVNLRVTYQVVMSVDSAVTYSSVHSEARSWSIPYEDPYEEA
nr:hypothetical protein [Tanacetum cinerariifolium]